MKAAVGIISMMLLFNSGCASQRTAVPSPPDAVQPGPTREGLLAAFRQLHHAACKGDRKTVCSFFLGGEYPGGERYSWNRYMIGTFMDPDFEYKKNVDPCSIPVLRVEGNCGATIYQPHAADGEPWREGGGYKAVFWRFRTDGGGGGRWYVSEPMPNPNPEENRRWEDFLREQTQKGCTKTLEDAFQLSEKLRQLGKAVTEADLMPLVSDHNYMRHTENSWSLEMDKWQMANVVMKKIRSSHTKAVLYEKRTRHKRHVGNQPVAFDLGKERLDICVHEIVYKGTKTDGEDWLILNFVEEDGELKLTLL